MTFTKKYRYYLWFPFSLFIVCLFLFNFFIPPANAEKRVVLVGVYENSPKVFLNDSGRPDGIFIDIIEHIANIEGWELKYLYSTWPEGLQKLQNGEIDLMPDVAYSASRNKIFDFNKEPVLSSWFQVYSNKESKIVSILDLQGKKVVVLERSVQQAAFEQLASEFQLNLTLITMQDYNTMFEFVSKGDADAVVSNGFYGSMNAKKYGLEDTAVIFSPSPLFFASPPGKGKDLLSVIDKHLEALKKNPQSVYYQSLKKWTSEEVSYTIPQWIKLLGLIIGLTLIITFITTVTLNHQVKLRTMELQQINHEMEKRIETRTEELASAMKKAQAADHLKSAFLASMSHELRTPLNSIIGFTGILLQGLAGSLNEEQKKQLQMVQNSSRHLLALINDVLDISRIEAGQLALSNTTFDLAVSIKKVISMVALLAEKKGLDLKLTIADDISEITIDQRRLEQVLLNLINNGIKFTEKGSVEVLCKKGNDQYIIAISDTGIGISEDEINKMFKPFYQVDTGLTRKHEGTGLGLTISKKLIEMMGGTINVQSQLNKGSTFTVHIFT